MKNKKTISLLLAAIMVLSLFAGCGSQKTAEAPAATEAPAAAAATEAPKPAEAPKPTEAPAEEPKTITVTDDAGRTVEVPYPVERVALLDTGFFEFISATGRYDVVVGNHQGMVGNVLFDEIQDLPLIATHSEINFEALAQTQPQVIFSSISSHGVVSDNENLNQFEIADIKLDLRRPQVMRHGIEVMGQVLGEEAKAAEIIAFYDKWEQFISERVSKIPEEDRVRVYFEYHAGPFKTGAKDSSWHTQIPLAGGINIAQDLEGNSGVEISSEWLAENNPDFIIREASGMGGRATDTAKAKEIYDEIMTRDGLEMVTAIKEKNVHLVSVEITSRPGYIVGVSYMAKWFYPELFEDFNPDDVLKEYFEIFHPGKDVVGVWTYDE